MALKTAVFSVNSLLFCDVHVELYNWAIRGQKAFDQVFPPVHAFHFCRDWVQHYSHASRFSTRKKKAQQKCCGIYPDSNPESLI